MTYSLRNLWTDRALVREVYRGWRHYASTGETPDPAYQSLIRLHCRTNGLSTDVLAALVRRFHRPITLDARRGVLGAIPDQYSADALASLERDGYVVFDAKLPSEILDELRRFAETTPATVESDARTVTGPIVYDRLAPQSRRYHFAEQTVIDNPAVQRLMADQSLLAFAQKYFGTAPLFDYMAMWWSTTFSAVPGSEAAQLFHFDYDRIKWLKIFFYLTDVTDDRGPHCFVKGSHRRGFQGAEKLLAHGYARLTDEEVIGAFGHESIASITGKAGTIIAVDTRGFHKGIVPRTGDRLILQFQYATSEFGGTVPRSHLTNIVVPELREIVKKIPSSYRRYLDHTSSGRDS